MVAPVRYEEWQSSEIKKPPERPSLYITKLWEDIGKHAILLLEDIPQSGTIQFSQERTHLAPDSSSDNITPEEEAYMEELQKIIEKIFKLSQIKRDTNGKDPLTVRLCNEQIKILNDEADKLPSKYGITIY